MKRYDTHRNFPPTRRPRDSTPAPPEDDELERLLAVPRGESLPDVVNAEAPREPESAVERSALPASSSVADAVTSYVESLPASDPEPRIEDREIDVDAEATRRAENALETVRALKSASALDAVSQPSSLEDARRHESASADDDADDDDADDDDDDEEPDSVAPESAPSSESAPVDSIAALAQSTAPKARARSGLTPLLLVGGFALTGIALALWSIRNVTEVHEKSAAASQRAAAEPISAPALARTVTTGEPSPAPSASAFTPQKALPPQGP
jgi:hypothetical protein